MQATVKSRASREFSLRPVTFPADACPDHAPSSSHRDNPARVSRLRANPTGLFITQGYLD